MSFVAFCNSATLSVALKSQLVNISSPKSVHCMFLRLLQYGCAWDPNPKRPWWLHRAHGCFCKSRWNSGPLLCIIPVTWIHTMLWWNLFQLIFFLVNLHSRGRMVAGGCCKPSVLAGEGAGGRWAALGLEDPEKLFLELRSLQKLLQGCISLFWGRIFRSGRVITQLWISLELEEGKA